MKKFVILAIYKQLVSEFRIECKILQKDSIWGEKYHIHQEEVGCGRVEASPGLTRVGLKTISEKTQIFAKNIKPGKTGQLIKTHSIKKKKAFY